MLLAIKQYFSDHRMANLEDLSRYFQQAPEDMRRLLSHWIQKGRLCRIDAPNGCGTRCRQCPVGEREVYRWEAVSFVIGVKQRGGLV